MIVKEYHNAGTFLAEYEAVLLEQEAIGQLVLYSAYHCCQSDDCVNALFGAVVEDKTIFLLFCNVLPYNLEVYVVKPNQAAAAVEILADYFGRNRIAIIGIYAKGVLCQVFMEMYKKYMNCTFVEKLRMDIMELRSVNDIKPADGMHRLATPEEVKLAAEWMIEFQLEALTNELDYEAALQKAEILIQEGKVYFYEIEEQKIVSMAVAARELSHGIAITYIYTPEEHRGKGYAAANIYYLSKALLERGYEFCTLFVDKKNPLSNRAYEKVGFKVIDDIYEYKVVPI